LGRRFIDLGKVSIHANTGLQHDQRDRCQHLKINDCPESDAADRAMSDMRAIPRTIVRQITGRNDNRPSPSDGEA
jgi:hypothetical protein